MPTFGTVTGNVVSDGESSYFHWELIDQNIAGNYSVINWQAGWNFVGNSCRGLRKGSAAINGSYVYYDYDPGDGVHSYNPAHDHRPQLQTAAGFAFVLPHQADGTATLSGFVGMTGFSGQLSQGSANFALPTIPRNPGAPSTPVLSEVKQTSVLVSWSPNPSDGLPNTNYTIGYGTTPSAPETTTTSTTSPKIITGLLPGVKYYFWVKATNSVGEGPYSASSNATTVAGARINVVADVGYVWRQAIPYVKVAGVWRLAQPWVKTLGEWKETL